jgi:hypothetical protein
VSEEDGDVSAGNKKWMKGEEGKVLGEEDSEGGGKHRKKKGAEKANVSTGSRKRIGGEEGKVLGEEESEDLRVPPIKKCKNGRKFVESMKRRRQWRTEALPSVIAGRRRC